MEKIAGFKALAATYNGETGQIDYTLVGCSRKEEVAREIAKLASDKGYEQYSRVEQFNINVFEDTEDFIANPKEKNKERSF